eukprot:10813636-Alexandrium_andersonii.AAC.1
MGYQPPPSQRPFLSLGVAVGDPGPHQGPKGPSQQLLAARQATARDVIAFVSASVPRCGASGEDDATRNGAEAAGGSSS